MNLYTHEHPNTGENSGVICEDCLELTDGNDPSLVLLTTPGVLTCKVCEKTYVIERDKTTTSNE